MSYNGQIANMQQVMVMDKFFLLMVNIEGGFIVLQLRTTNNTSFCLFPQIIFVPKKSQRS